jgi:ABC-type nickel/cobalt efflux system permease component RcnA
VFATNAYSTSATGGLTEALQALPAAGPLDERTVAMSVSAARMPAGAAGLGPRPPAGLPVVRAPGGADNRWITQKTRQLVDSIAGPRLEPRVAVLAVLAALLLGAVHALAPGHGKTIVGAYLIGSRGTPRHAVFLGLTVTATHTLGVFALGFLTLYASRFIVPERLFPLLGLVSALLVLGMGLALLVQRTRAAGRRLGLPWIRRATVYRPFVLLAHTADIGTWHSHGGGAPHSHLPPGAGGERVTWRSLLTLGISGGLVPCPSAMVLLLAAIALNKTAYGMLLVLVFSIGLALTLTAVGLVFLYARSRFPRPSASARWPHWLPVLSAATITLVGVALSVGALKSL